MSVQVRRRREAAAFLSTYVGAQGELIVDTTGSRVQVHDGVTPGGFPAAGIGDIPGRNVLINATFAVNQRAYASAAALATGTYAHDRWKAGSSGCAYTFTQTVPDTAITIVSGTLSQAVDAPNIYATAYWLTWSGTAPARVWQGAAAGSFALGTAMTIAGVSVNALLVTGLAVGTVANLEFGAGTLGLVQFEAVLPNAGPTRFERRHLSAEQLLCLRCFEKSAAQGSPVNAGFPGTIMYTLLNAASANYAVQVFVPFKAIKRVVPTLTLYSPHSGASGKAYDNTVGADVAAYAFNAGDGSFQFYAQVAAATGNVGLYAHYAASAEI